jgi:hypothetical protein
MPGLLISIVVALGVALLGAWHALRRRRRLDAARGPLRSLLMLRTAPRGLTESVVRTAVVRALGEEPSIEIRPFDETTVGFLAGLADGSRLLLLDSRRRYGNDPEDLDEPGGSRAFGGDTRLEKAWREHEAWCSVDLYGRCGDEEAESLHLPRLAKVLAALADPEVDDGVLAFVRTDASALAPATTAVRKALAAGNARTPFGLDRG